jgi:hypothetical protein
MIRPLRTLSAISIYDLRFTICDLAEPDQQMGTQVNSSIVNRNSKIRRREVTRVTRERVLKLTSLSSCAG